MLRPCTGCRRPVRLAEAACPFCAAALGPAVAPKLVRRLALGTVVAVMTAGCIHSVYGAPMEPRSPSPSATPEVPR